MKNILFVCTGNSCRSVMAEGLFKKFVEGRSGKFSVSSAGISAVDGFPATEETVRVMREAGADVSNHQSRRLTLEMIKSADKIFVMERFHKDWVLRLAPEADDKVMLLTEYSKKGDGFAAEIDIPDPIRMSDHFYQNIMSIIRDCVKKIAESL